MTAVATERERIDRYLDRIREIYDSSNEEEMRFLIVGGLEGFLKDIGSIRNGAMPSHNGNGFDGRIARRIRRGNDLSMKQLGEVIGCSHSTISRIETGTVSTKHPRKATRKYLLWLKEQGYDPNGV